MMARSPTRSNQRPDTLMQDRICQVDETSCNARPDHTFGSIATGLAVQKFRRCPLCSGSRSKVGGCRRFAMQSLRIRPPKQGGHETKRSRCRNVATRRFGSGPSSSGVRQESFPPRAGGAALTHTNAPMDPAESPRGIVVGSTPSIPALKAGHRGQDPFLPASDLNAMVSGHNGLFRAQHQGATQSAIVAVWQEGPRRTVCAALHPRGRCADVRRPPH